MEEEKKFFMKYDGDFVQGFTFVKKKCKLTTKPELAIKMSQAQVDKFVRFCKENGTKAKLEVIAIK